MTEWSLSNLLVSLHDDIERRLEGARKVFGHPGTKGDASETVWRDLLKGYLPKRYEVASAHVVDSNGLFSQQIDVVVFDRQYSPFVFHYEGQVIIPAESVYAVFEAKQNMNAQHMAYAKEKIASVRSLHRTSLPVPTIDGEKPAKTPQHIIGGLLAFDSDWKPAFGDAFFTALDAKNENELIDIGCCAASGSYWRTDTGDYETHIEGKAATAFLLELIARLQASATVPMIDVRKYANWLAK